MNGVKHLIQCRCILPQFMNVVPPVFHRFPVFSIINDDDNVELKLVNCDNCGATHRVTDLFKSKIIQGKEDTKIAMSSEDIRASLPQKLGDLLASYGVHISVWEEVQFLFQTGTFGTEIILIKDDIDGIIQGKKLKIVNANDYIVSSFSTNAFIGEEK